MFTNTPGTKYQATKIIRINPNYKTCYVAVPKWLIGYTVKIIMFSTEIYSKKKVNKSNKISFPLLLAGQKVLIIYEK